MPFAYPDRGVRRLVSIAHVSHGLIGYAAERLRATLIAAVHLARGEPSSYCRTDAASVTLWEDLCTPKTKKRKTHPSLQRKTPPSPSSWHLLPQPPRNHNKRGPLFDGKPGDNAVELLSLRHMSQQRRDVLLAHVITDLIL